MGRSSYAQGGGRIMRCRKRGWRSFSLSRQCARSGRTIAQAGHKRPKQYQRRFIVLVGMGSWKGSAEVHEPPFPRVLFRKTAWIRLHCLSQIGSFEEHCPDQVWTSALHFSAKQNTTYVQSSFYCLSPTQIGLETILWASTGFPDCWSGALPESSPRASNCGH
jgi:hypothetical protein